MDIYVLKHVFKFFLLAPELQDLEQVAVVCVYDDMTVSVRVGMRVGMRRASVLCAVEENGRAGGGYCVEVSMLFIARVWKGVGQMLAHGSRK